MPKLSVVNINGKSYSESNQEKTNLSKNLVFKNKRVLVPGVWNDVNFTAALIKSMVEEVLSSKPDDQRRCMEIFADHWSALSMWVGQASNLHWDEKEMAAIADIEIVDEPTIKKLKYKIDELKSNDWGISPTLYLERDNNGTLIKISLKNLGLVLDPAQGKETALERLRDAEETIIFLKEELGLSKNVIPFHDYGKMDENTPWDASSETTGTNVEILKKICAWYDSSKPDNATSYKLPHHKKDGGNKAVWNGVKASMGALMGARGGVKIPSGDRRGVYNHLKKHYAHWGKTAPSFLEINKNEGGKEMRKFNVADIANKSGEETDNYCVEFLGLANAELKKFKTELAGANPSLETLQKQITDIKNDVELAKTKVSADEQESFTDVVGEAVLLLGLAKKFIDAKPKLEQNPVMRLNFEGDGKFQASDGSKNRFKKELIREGAYLDPRNMTSRFEVNQTRMTHWVENFKKNLKRVPVPIRHTDDPLRNTGWLTDLALEGPSLFGFIEFTNPLAAEMAANGSIKDVSIGIDPDFVDTKTGQHHGEAIEHVALTMVPHITNLSQFEPIAAEAKREVLEFAMKKEQIVTDTQNPTMVTELLKSNANLQSRLFTLEKERDLGLQDRITKRVEELVKGGRLTPGLKNRVLQFALASRSQNIELEKGNPQNMSDELLGILEGMEITFEMAQTTKQNSDRPQGEKKYLTSEDISNLSGDKYKKAYAEGKIAFEEKSGAAYWV